MAVRMNSGSLLTDRAEASARPRECHVQQEPPHVDDGAQRPLWVLVIGPENNDPLNLFQRIESKDLIDGVQINISVSLSLLRQFFLEEARASA